MILFLTRVPPNPNGHGASQRAMHLLKGLARIAPVDLAVIYRDGDGDAEKDALEQAAPFARSATKVLLPDWAAPTRRWPRAPGKLAQVAELITPYCGEAPRLGRSTLERLAGALPRRDYHMVFAGRLPSAVVCDQLARAGLLRGDVRLVDLDDIMSRWKERQLAVEGKRNGRLRWALDQVDLRRIREAEDRVLAGWDAASVCTDEDVRLLEQRSPAARVVRVPNVVDRERLPERPPGEARVLFVGSLAALPNLQGLRAFLDGAWPAIRAAVPEATLDVVGMMPPPGMDGELAAVGGRLHADAPSVLPFYRDCDVVIAPIFFGGGTRIKILEAMAYGRAIVSTTIGAEGLGLENGRHALIADDMPGLAEAVVRLCRDPDLRHVLADAAAALQRERFGPDAIDAALGRMVDRASASS